MRVFDAELQRFKEQLRGLYNQMCEYAMSMYDQTLEISIYGQLLTGEESRMVTQPPKVNTTIITMKVDFVFRKGLQ